MDEIETDVVELKPEDRWTWEPDIRPHHKYPEIEIDHAALIPRMNGVPRCTAVAKNTMQQCDNPATSREAPRKCRFHGGVGQLKGPNHPGFTHGSTSRYWRAPQVRHLYEEGLDDPDLLSHTHEVALVQARIQQLMDLVAEGESYSAWLDLKKAIRMFDSARAIRDTNGMAQAMELIREAARSGEANHAGWRELTDLIEQRRKLVDTEMKQRLKLGHLVTSTQVLGLVKHLVHLVTSRVDDPEVVEGIVTEVGKLIDAPPDDLLVIR